MACVVFLVYAKTCYPDLLFEYLWGKKFPELFTLLLCNNVQMKPICTLAMTSSTKTSVWSLASCAETWVLSSIKDIPFKEWKAIAI